MTRAHCKKNRRGSEWMLKEGGVIESRVHVITGEIDCSFYFCGGVGDRLYEVSGQMRVIICFESQNDGTMQRNSKQQLALDMVATPVMPALRKER